MSLRSWLHELDRHLNFFRYHVLFFTFTPLIFSGIFYAANGHADGNANSGDAVGVQRVTYVDSLFLCYSAMTVTGLVPVNISALHPFQQVMLFVLFICGDYTFVSYIMVLVRKRFFRTHCIHTLKTTKSLRPSRTKTFLNRAMTIVPSRGGRSGIQDLSVGEEVEKGKVNDQAEKGKVKNGLRRGQRRSISAPMDARMVNDYIEEPTSPQVGTGLDSPTAFLNENRAHGPEMDDNGLITASTTAGNTPAVVESPVESQFSSHAHPHPPAHPHFLNDPHPHDGMRHRPVTYGGRQYATRQMLRERTLTLAPVTDLDDLDPATQSHHPIVSSPLTRSSRRPTVQSGLGQGHGHHDPIDVHSTPKPKAEHIPLPNHHKNVNYGGFSYPPFLLHHLIPSKWRQALLRKISKRDDKGLTLLTHPTIGPGPEGLTQGGKLVKAGKGQTIGTREGTADSFSEQVKARVAKWMPDGMGGLVIGRNGRFYTEELDEDVIEQLGGVEYSALKALSWLIPAYILFIEIIPFAVMAIYLAKVNSWNTAFQQSAGVQAHTINKTWFALFLSCSAFSGTGMSLVDQSMVPFNQCYLVVFALFFVLILGNHALPMTLRFIVWIGTKLFNGGEIGRTLHFLLDHPRRCYLYLFPSQQTWYLTFILIFFLVTEMFAFLVLDIDLPVLTNLHPPFQKFANSLFQSASVRATGFGIIPIASLAPSVLFLYVILMYVAIYPIALSVRSTNVYEERSLGVFEHEDQSLDDENEPAYRGRRGEVFGKYLWWHTRRQLAFDIWPLTLAIFVIACLERGKLLDPARQGYFTIFRIIFECTSAYTTIGLTMGTPNNNYSFVGEFGTASKLVIILVMLRGRHRGLPLAIDRAIILPHEYANDNDSHGSSHAHKDEGEKNAGPNGPVPAV